MSLLSSSLAQIQLPSWYKEHPQSHQEITKAALRRREALLAFLEKEGRPLARGEIMKALGVDQQAARSTIGGCVNRGLVEKVMIDGFAHWRLACST